MLYIYDNFCYHVGMIKKEREVMSKEYWVHVHSHTSYIVSADSEEQAEGVALEEFNNINFDSTNFICNQEGKIEISLDTEEEQ